MCVARSSGFTLRLASSAFRRACVSAIAVALIQRGSGSQAHEPAQTSPPVSLRVPGKDGIGLPPAVRDSRTQVPSNFFRSAFPSAGLRAGAGANPRDRAASSGAHRNMAHLLVLVAPESTGRCSQREQESGRGAVTLLWSRGAGGEHRVKVGEGRAAGTFTT